MLLHSKKNQCWVTATSVKRGVWSYDLDAPRTLPATSPPPSYRRLFAASRPLAHLATLSIGVVTGANRVFLLSKREVAEAGIAQTDLKPILTRSRQDERVLP